MGTYELDGIRPKYVDSGHLLFETDSDIMAVAADLDPPKLLGAPVPLEGGSRINQLSVTRDGHLFRGWGDSIVRTSLRSFERAGWNEPPTLLAAPPAGYDEFNVSPSDPDKVAVELPSEEGGESLWVLDIRTGVGNRLTFGDVGDNPSWHPSGDSILYVDRATGNSSLVLRAADGSGVPRILYSANASRFGFPHSTSNFDRVVFVRDEDIWSLDTRTGEARALIVELEQQSHPRPSPDGAFVAYTGTQVSGSPRVFMEPMTVDGSRWDLSRGIGWQPVWAPDGSAVYYGTPDGIYRVSISTAGGRIAISNPEKVLEAGQVRFDILPDGSGMVYTRAEGSEGADGGESSLRYLDVVFNWTTELSRLVPR
jgi:hypothetical protein